MELVTMHIVAHVTAAELLGARSGLVRIGMVITLVPSVRVGATEAVWARILVNTNRFGCVPVLARLC